MGCWAVPTVAAEVWGVPLKVVLDAIEDGTILSRTEVGMVLVDVDPAGIGAARRRSDRRPTTFSPAPIDGPASPPDLPTSPPDEEPDRPLNFISARQRATHTRRSPCAEQQRAGVSAAA